jgi:hypothetical protein
MPSKEVTFEHRARTRTSIGCGAFLAPCRRRCVLSFAEFSDKDSRYDGNCSFEYWNTVEVGHICIESQRIFGRADHIDIKNY